MYTRKQCKKDMIMMWTWLAKTGEEKDDYLDSICKNRAESTYNRFITMIFRCPCCTYVGWNAKHTTAQCDKCPITWKNHVYFEDSPICTRQGNEFQKWDSGSDRKKYAAQILELAKQIKEE